MQELKNNIDNNIPDFLKDSYNENLCSDDLQMPEFMLAQPLSEAIQEETIPGLKVGEFYNPVTATIYGAIAEFIPAFFEKAFVIWKDRSEGGGFFGSFPTQKEALDTIKGLPEPGLAIFETHYHYGFIIQDDTLDAVRLSCSRTKLVPSRNLNTYVLMSKVPRGGIKFYLKAVKVKSKHGAYYTFTVNAVKDKSGKPVYVTSFQYGMVKELRSRLEISLNDSF